MAKNRRRNGGKHSWRITANDGACPHCKAGLHAPSKKTGVGRNSLKKCVACGEVGCGHKECMRSCGDGPGRWQHLSC